MNPLWFVYILTNYKNTVLYVGYTNSLKRRIKEHKRGVGNSFTKRYRLYKLIWYHVYASSIEAMRMEKTLKGWTREKKLVLISKTNPNYKDLFTML